MNRIDQLFLRKTSRVLSVYFTAGYPARDDTITIIKELESTGVDAVEIGIPFSDPVADGPILQASNQKALDNGMTLKLLFNQLENIREKINIPLILMGYLNPVLRYGIKEFCEHCKSIGIDGVIIPDLPLKEYIALYKQTFRENEIYNIFLISPMTSDERIREIDKIGQGFIYVVSASSTTGEKDEINSQQMKYFQRINTLGLKLPRLIGFGISSKDTFVKASQYANGVIIGSAFVKQLGGQGTVREVIKKFIGGIKSE